MVWGQQAAFWKTNAAEHFNIYQEKIQMNHRFKCKNGVIKVLEINVREFAIIVEW